MSILMPTLRSERPDGTKDTFLVNWQFGLAGIAAEAEDTNWAKRLYGSQKSLAARRTAGAFVAGSSA
jgi:hypothetical protein